MFTVKFYKHREENEAPEYNENTSVSCQSYTHYKTSTSETVTVYKGMTQTDGVEYHVNDGHNLAYDICYVENSSGKTIDSMGKTVPHG